MSHFEFMKYDATPAEKHLGIATVKLYGKIILRYKIVPNKDGSGYFPASASYKMSEPGRPEYYVSAFMLDSQSDNEELMNMIRANIKPFISGTQSVFNQQAQASTQPNPNYNPYPQQNQQYAQQQPAQAELPF